MNKNLLIATSLLSAVFLLLRVKYWLLAYILTLLDKDAANLSNHQTNRLQKDTICVKFDEKNLLPPNKVYHGAS
jgi:hypothetical protein